MRHADERRGLAAAIQKIDGAPTGVAALREMVALQARMNPEIWPLARMLDAVRRQDEAAEQSWQDRLQSRLTGCRRIVGRLVREGTLRRGVTPAVAANLLWVLTSLRTWEDLVLQRRWSLEQYERRLCDLLLVILTACKGSLSRGAISVEQTASGALQTSLRRPDAYLCSRLAISV